MRAFGVRSEGGEKESVVFKEERWTGRVGEDGVVAEVGSGKVGGTVDGDEGGLHAGVCGWLLLLALS